MTRRGGAETEQNAQAAAKFDRDNGGYCQCIGVDEGTIRDLEWTRVLSMHQHRRGYYLCTDIDKATVHAPP